MLASLVLCLAHLTVMPQQPLRDDREEPAAEVVGRDGGGMERWGEKMILQKSLLYRRK